MVYVCTYKIREICGEIYQLFLVNKISLFPNSVLLTSLQLLQIFVDFPQKGGLNN